jgi:hypothetical protein
MESGEEDTEQAVVEGADAENEEEETEDEPDE